MNRKKITIFLVLLTFVFLQVHALSVRDFTFMHLGQMEGLCNQRIYSVRQTPDGALWWSNKNDIERYNGVQIKHYRLEKDPLMSMLAGRTIKLTLPAPTHNDWSLLAFDNKGAIYTYNKMQDRFQLVADVKTLLKTDVNLNDILETDAGIWLATNQGVFLLHDNKVETVAKGVHTNSIIKTDWYLLFCTKSGVLKYTNTHHPSPKYPRTLKVAIMMRNTIKRGSEDSHKEFGFFLMIIPVVLYTSNIFLRLVMRESCITPSVASIPITTRLCSSVPMERVYTRFPDRELKGWS